MSDDNTPRHNDLPSPDPSSSNFPSPDNLIAEIQSADDSEDTVNKNGKYFQKSFNEIALDSQKKWVHLKGLEEHYVLKKGWSKALKWLLICMIAFQWILLMLVGWGRWDFTQYEWLLPILLVQNLGQIIGLALIVVKSLFRELKS